MPKLLVSRARQVAERRAMEETNRLARALRQPMRMRTHRLRDINRLNAFLSGEHAAVQTYTQCIQRMKDPAVIGRLRKLRASHAQRVKMLTQKIQELGGQPVSDSSLWTSFAKMVEGSAKLLSKSAAVSTLRTGERHGRLEYTRQLPQLSDDTRRFVLTSMLPQQVRTHDALRALQREV